MSELRKRLELARDAHRAARYPGDLAALLPRLSLWKVAAQVAVVTAAVAAVVLLAIRLSSVSVEAPTEPLAGAPVDEWWPAAVVFPALAMPAVPEGFASPPTAPLSFSPPGFRAVSLSIEFPLDSKETI